jgi:PTH1 family peptidyl-tRNA hydrolase
MKLIIGLGNAGEKYKKTRHNFGFMAVDCLRQKFGGFSDWTMDKKANSLVSRGEILGEKIILAKPQALMNLSGQTAAALANFFNFEPKDIWVIHDDFDLPLGVMRLNQNSSAAGHKGVVSIINALNSKDFLRFRLGIHPVGQTFLSVLFKKINSIEKFVLKNFSKEEIKTVEQLLNKLADAVRAAIKDGSQKAMSDFN